MGELELVKEDNIVIIRSNIYLYGYFASEELSIQFADEIESMWNKPQGYIELDNDNFQVKFKVKGIFAPEISEIDILKNTNPQNNYFRVEDYSPSNISWVDGLNSNSGYMLIDNLYKGSTTAAHEYGHTLGLSHPENINLLGKGYPGIMFPRGTLVDREYQYDFNASPGQKGGTLHPKNRIVRQEDIDLLDIPSLLMRGKKYIGDFSSIYHPKYSKDIIFS